jgi:hypothetical protein
MEVALRTILTDAMKGLSWNNLIFQLNKKKASFKMSWFSAREKEGCSAVCSKKTKLIIVLACNNKAIKVRLWFSRNLTRIFPNNRDLV